jgi:trehalose-6-phosphatase
VLAVGDDRSDEDMFTAIEHYADTPRHPAEVRGETAEAGSRACLWVL